VMARPSPVPPYCRAVEESAWESGVEGTCLGSPRDARGREARVPGPFDAMRMAYGLARRSWRDHRYRVRDRR
jgi:hypothetical protein